MADPMDQPAPPDINDMATADPATVWKSLKHQMPDVAAMIENMLINGKDVNEIMQFAITSGLPEPVVTGTMRAIAWRRRQIFGNRNVG